MSEFMTPVPGYAHTFVTRSGDVFTNHPGNRWRGRLVKLTATDNGRGYLRVSRNSKQVCVHALVALAFLGPKPPGLEVNHKDGNKRNNRPENLEYVTRSENMKHAHAMGLASPKCGDGHPNRVYTDAQKGAICWDFLAMLDGRPRMPNGAMKYLMLKYKVSDCYIYRVAEECRWRDAIDLTAQRWKARMFAELVKEVGRDDLPIASLRIAA